jgi:aryl-alcohol dehydrogenase-like predicted oxidoreductase
MKNHTGKLGLGCVTFGREIDEEASYRIMDYALRNGITLFDTAESYGGGEARLYRRERLGIDDIREVTGELHSSEKVIGRWLKRTGCRNQIILQTKVSSEFTRSGIARCIEASLERLQTDSIDFYLLHRFEGAVPLEETLDPIAGAIHSGKIAAMGCSNFNLEQLRQACEVSRRFGIRVEMAQPLYNLVAREIENDFLSFCKSERIAVVPYSPLGAGFLSGKYVSGQTFPKGSRFDVKPGHADIYFSEQNFRTVARLGALSQRTGIPMVRLAMGWVLRNPDLTAVLVGARSTAHLDNALEALGLEFPDEWAAELTCWIQATAESGSQREASETDLSQAERLAQ